jgi:hypothetical protein
MELSWSLFFFNEHFLGHSEPLHNQVDITNPIPSLIVFLFLEKEKGKQERRPNYFMFDEFFS